MHIYGVASQPKHNDEGLYSLHSQHIQQYMLYYHTLYKFEIIYSVQKEEFVMK